MTETPCHSTSNKFGQCLNSISPVAISFLDCEASNLYISFSSPEPPLHIHHFSRSSLFYSKPLQKLVMLLRLIQLPVVSALLSTALP